MFSTYAVLKPDRASLPSACRIRRHTSCRTTSAPRAPLTPRPAPSPTPCPAGVPLASRCLPASAFGAALPSGGRVDGVCVCVLGGSISPNVATWPIGTARQNYACSSYTRPAFATDTRPAQPAAEHKAHSRSAAPCFALLGYRRCRCTPAARASSSSSTARAAAGSPSRATCGESGASPTKRATSPPSASTARLFTPPGLYDGLPA